jgi:DHA1 family bicyclomycin/chloramphenicol resistance-like MFS transporter
MNTPAHATAMSPNLVVLCLALLLGLQPVTTDLYLPALPDLSQELGASMGQTQLTLSALLLAFGISQLVWGPLSDRFGRRPILLVGMLAYVVASIGSALSPNIATLVVWRILQGVAMGAGVVCARAIVRDLYQPAQGATVMSKGLSGLGVIACLCAPLGGLLTAIWSWHVALLALAVFGAATLAVVVWRFEETAPQRNPRALELLALVRTWRAIVSNPVFVTFSLLSALSYGGLVTFLASSSFVFIRVLGLSPTQYGLVMLGMSLAYLIGTFMCRYLIRHYGLQRAVAVAAVFSITGGSLMGIMAMLGIHSAWAIAIPQVIFNLGHGIHQPCGQSGAVGPFPQSAGTASALNGFFMMVTAFATGQWLGVHMDGTAMPMALGMWFWGTLLALVAWTLVQRFGKPQ